MSNGGSILEQMLEAAVSGGGLRGGGRGMGRGSPGGGGLGGGLGDLLNSVLAGASQGTGPEPRQSRSSGRGGGGDLSDILRDFSRRVEAGGGGGGGRQRREAAPARQPSRQGPAAETSRPRPEASRPQADPAGEGQGGLMRYGGLAVLGALAYTAYKNWQAEQAGSLGQQAPAAPAAAALPPDDSGFHPQQAPGGADALSDVLLKAMIAATQADGVVDEEEQRRIAGKLDEVGMGEEDRPHLAMQLATRVDPNELVRAATSPEAGVQIYAASVLAISADTEAERRYLDALASALGIDAGLKAHVERTLSRG